MTGLLGTYFPAEDPMAPVDLMPRGLLGPSVLGRMQAHSDAQRQRMAAGDYSPTPMDEESMWLADDLAGGILGSLPGGVMGAIKAYHGSPHRFDRFDMSKIGTGEGAQAYGHGLYFAESEGVAKSYLDALTGPDSWFTIQFDDGRKIAGSQMDDSLKSAATYLEDAQKYTSNTAEAAAEAKARLAGSGSPPLQVKLIAEKIDELSNAGVKFSYEQPPGALYTTRLDVEPEDLLDWDAPLSQQSEKVRAALEPLLRPSKTTTQADDDLLAALMDGPGADELRAAADAMPDWNPTGAEVYRALFGGKTESVFGNSANAREVSQALLEAGIPGIRYLDQGSRGYKVSLSIKGKPYGDQPRDFATKAQADAYAKEKQAEGFQTEVVQDGTRNFVIFDDKLIDIEGVE